MHHIFGLKPPENMTSWELFDILLEKVQIVSTPGSGFGPHGEGYLRLTSFGSRENTIRAVERIKLYSLIIIQQSDHRSKCTNNYIHRKTGYISIYSNEMYPVFSYHLGL